MPDAFCTSCGKTIIEGIHFCPHCGAKQPSPLSPDEVQRDPYRILQVSVDAEPEVIEAAYRGLARKYHPDASTPSMSEQRMQEINWAHDILTDPSKLASWKRGRPGRAPSGPSTFNPNATVGQSPPPSGSVPLSNNTPTYHPTPPEKPAKAGFGCGPTLLVATIVGLAILLLATQIPAGRPLSPSPTSSSALHIQPTSRPANTTLPRPTATHAPAITYRGTSCIKWSEVSPTLLDLRVCVYGRIYTYGPYSNRWNTIQFSPATNSFRVVDFNYYYITPLQPGDCAIVYGRIRDNGAYLLITPDKDSDDAVGTMPGSTCD